MYLGGQGNVSGTRQIIVIGGNDVRDAIGAYLTSGPAAAGQIILEAVTAIYDNIQLLAANGAQEFLVGNVPDLGKVPRDELYWGLGIEAFWVVFFIAMARVMFRRGVRRYSGFGG